MPEWSADEINVFSEKKQEKTWNMKNMLELQDIRTPQLYICKSYWTNMLKKKGKIKISVDKACSR